MHRYFHLPRYEINIFLLYLIWLLVLTFGSSRDPVSTRKSATGLPERSKSRTETDIINNVPSVTVNRINLEKTCRGSCTISNRTTCSYYFVPDERSLSQEEQIKEQKKGKDGVIVDWRLQYSSPSGRKGLGWRTRFDLEKKSNPIPRQESCSPFWRPQSPESDNCPLGSRKPYE